MAGSITERIPHKTVAYAYLEIQAATANEFEKLRAEALKRIPHYGFAAQAPAESKTVAPAEVAAEPAEEAAGPEVGPAEVAAAAAPAPQTEQASAGAAPSTQGLSPREIAKAKMAAKKEAQSG